MHARALRRGHPIHVEPIETAVAWAYDLDLRPLPVFQGYQAYTPRLDRLNAEAVLASDAPSRILFGTHAPVDGRVGGWESPAAMRAILCRYQAFLQRGGWLVMGRAENRCGPERPIATRTARWGEPVPVPPPSPDGMVIVKIHGMEPGLGERLRAALHKGRERSVRFDDRTPARMVADTAGEGLLLHAPPGVDLPEGFTKAPQPETMAVDIEGGADGTLRYEFLFVPVAQ